MKDIKIYIVGGEEYSDYSNWILNHTIVKTIEESDLVLFAGGEDVNPKYYGELCHPTTSYNDNRDISEIKEFYKAKELNKHLLGVCRGSQFLCMMNKGSLVQHQENPSFKHSISTIDDKHIIVTSTHHQAQYPFNLPNSDYKIIGWTKDLSKFHKNGNNQELNPKVECEIVYYPNTKSLGIQSHPEFCYPPITNDDVEYIEYVQELLNKFLKNEL